MDTLASIPRIDSVWKIDFDVDMDMGTSIPNLFPNRFQESIFHPWTRLQIPAQCKLGEKLAAAPRIKQRRQVEVTRSRKSARSSLL